MKSAVKKQIKKDNLKIIGKAIPQMFLFKLTAAAAPVLSAYLMGDMTNFLLNLDVIAIKERLPAFLVAVFLEVFAISIFELQLNLTLTKKGFEYDSFLMNKFIHLPLSAIENTDAGSVMQNLEEDSADFNFNQINIWAYPFVISIWTLFFIYLLHKNHTPLLFTAAIMIPSVLPVIRASYVGKKQAELKKQKAEYDEKRKHMELELFECRDFAHCCSLSDFFTGRLQKAFKNYWTESGKIYYTLKSKEQILDFLCDYGAQITAILLGLLLVSLNRMSIGVLLSGFLMIPHIKRCFFYLKLLIEEIHNEDKYIERLTFFYSANSEEYPDFKIPESIKAENLSFSYQNENKVVLQDLDFELKQNENIRLVGENGSGKSTLMSLLSGLYMPHSGKICQNNNLTQLRKSTALQEQNGYIFAGTVWDNLFLPEKKKTQAREMLKNMGMAKPLYYNISANGANLSPGERKKIILTRALLKNAPFLMLDEPLNHLDTHGRNVLFSELKKRKGGVLLISHEDFPETDNFKIYKIN